MSRQRRNFSAKFKSDLVIELLKGEKDLNTLAVENNIQVPTKFYSHHHGDCGIPLYFLICFGSLSDHGSNSFKKLLSVSSICFGISSRRCSK